MIARTGVLILLALNSFGVSQEIPAKKERSFQALRFVDRARTLPPEFAATALLRIAQRPLIADAKWKIELIEEAFHFAGHAQLPYRQQVIGLSTDSRTYLKFYPNDLEALTLQSQAVEAMLLIDRARGLELFERIRLPEIAARTCQDVNIPDLKVFYRLAGKIFDSAFTDKQRKAEEHIRFLDRIILTVKSPAQVEPALHLILSANLQPNQRMSLAGKFATVLDQVSGDDRTFGATEAMAVPGASPELNNAVVILPALRSYLVRRLSGPRCHDNMPPAGQMSKAASNFNGLIARIDKEGAIYRLIAESEVRPGEDEGTFKNEFAWRSNRGKEVLSALQWLNHGNRAAVLGQPRKWTLEERNTEAWRSRYDATMKLIEGWKESEEETAEDYIFVVSHTYQNLAELAPTEDGRNRSMESHLRFLEQRYAGMESRNFWYAAIRMVFDRLKASRDEHEKAWLLGHLTRSANPVISLYAQLELEFGREAAR